MESAQQYQRQLLKQIHYANRSCPISEPVEKAYSEVPRHLFVSRYRRLGSKQWSDVDADNLAEHLKEIYADGPLILFGDDDGELASTISQPSLVLRMLDMLRLKSGQHVFELGAGSGWNAGLMGRLVGSTGHVYSLEIIPEVARRAAAAIQNLGISNVSIVEADGGEGYAPGAPYDRAIFTAGTYDLPRPFYDQIRKGGLVLIVIKSEGGGDCLFLLEKTGSHFESIESMQCAFVSMTGKHANDGLEPIYPEQLPEWVSLSTKKLARTPFWWSGKGKESFAWRTWGIRSYLAITEPLFRVFKAEKPPSSPYEESYFGLWDQTGKSLVLAKEDCLISYGTPAAKERLLEDLRRWVSLGMPTTANFQLRVFPDNVPIAPGENQWIVKRRDSQFLWSLPA